MSAKLASRTEARGRPPISTCNAVRQHTAQMTRHRCHALGAQRQHTAQTTRHRCHALGAQRQHRRQDIIAMHWSAQVRRKPGIQTNNAQRNSNISERTEPTRQIAHTHALFRSVHSRLPQAHMTIVTKDRAPVQTNCGGRAGRENIKST